MKIYSTITITFEIEEPSLKAIINAFRRSILYSFQDVVIQVLKSFAKEYMKNGKLAKLLNCSKVTWKTSHGNTNTTILTIFGRITIPQLQVKDKDTGRRKYITRLLLGIEPRIRIPELTTKMIGLMGALASFRVVRKISSMFTEVRFSLMTILRCVRETGEKIIFGVDSEQSNEFESDGTGMPIIRGGKRGKELKVLAQRKQNGSIRIAGMIIGRYKKGWGKLFKPIKEVLKTFGEIFLVTDGDVSILKGIKGIRVIIQRCLFHIPHETKYTLWKDKVKRRSKDWAYILAKILEITNIKRIREGTKIAENIIKWKKEQLIKLIDFCKGKGYNHTKIYLENAIADIFRGIERRVMGGTLSLIERVMRTINARIDIAQWSEKTALAVAKIRGAYYYNGFDV